MIALEFAQDVACDTSGMRDAKSSLIFLLFGLCFTPFEV